MKLDLPESLVARVSPRYAEPHRRYHTWAHVEACFLSRAKIMRDAGSISCDAIDLALLFHDAIYDPLAHDNEDKSAELLVDEGRRAGLDEALLARAVPLVLATKHGANVASSEEARIVVDADLSILGESREVFDAYERAVREEYAMIDDAIFRAGRVRVLRGFLERPAIFETHAGRDAWESRARENLAASLALLER
jgi:predicted metal-dependent HD superfamily phosphohydrolase